MENKEIIESVLKSGTDNIEFEPIPDENESPLAEPVIKKNNPSEDAKASKEEPASEKKSEPKDETKTEEPKAESQAGEQKEETAGEGFEEIPGEEETDAPEQEVDGDPEEGEGGAGNPDVPGSEEFEVPLEHAKLMADTLLGVVNNALEVGGGFFVTITKHKDFYDFDELIQVIDNQNIKNVKRLKLDKDDKALLRPLLIQVLRKKAKVMSPEQQLLMATLSILIKKAKLVLEIRKENDMLVERIRDIIRAEFQRHKVESENTGNANASTESKQEQNTEEPEEEKEEYEEDIEETVQEKQKYTGMPNSILETD